MRFALHVPNFAQPGELVELGVAAEAAGWDGLFLWDHLYGGPGFAVPMADPWVVLGVLAARTERLVLGTAVTPLPRRRPQKVAREAATVDHLSGGRMVLGVGLGSPPEEYTGFGEPADPRLLAGRLDEALEVVAQLWTGEPVNHRGQHFTVVGAQFLPPSVQRPRIPMWTACLAPHLAPLARAARWDGVVLSAPTESGGAELLPAAYLEAVVAEITRRRGDCDGFDLAVVSSGLPEQQHLDTYAEQGVTWVLATGWMDDLRQLARTPPQA